MVSTLRYYWAALQVAPAFPSKDHLTMCAFTTEHCPQMRFGNWSREEESDRARSNELCGNSIASAQRQVWSHLKGTMPLPTRIATHLKVRLDALSVSFCIVTTVFSAGDTAQTVPELVAVRKQ